MQAGELDSLYRRYFELAKSINLESQFESRYQYYRRQCWSRRECILVAAVDLKLPGQP